MATDLDMGLDGQTPGPWHVEHRIHVKAENGWRVATVNVPSGRVGSFGINPADNARLIAAAPDHALIGWAMCVGAGQWEPWGDGRGEFCMHGIRHATKLDAFGIPEVTPNLRAVIVKSQGRDRA
ncbi:MULTISPECIES: hypothetical protein [Alphaproteobacteria]|uniref:hypothetical protein n=1 Tax=Sphingopyxis sp. TaxID=1908224 RepID=UPI004034E80E